MPDGANSEAPIFTAKATAIANPPNAPAASSRSEARLVFEGFFMRGTNAKLA